MKKYTDTEMLMAAEIAYLNSGANGGDTQQNAGDLVEGILQQYGNYDSSTGTYTLKEGVSGADKAQFEAAQTVMQVGEQNNTYSWRSWTVMDACDKNNETGFYGCMIDTGEGDAIIAYRGSENYDLNQKVKDYGFADLGLLNNTQTRQQKDAAEYAQYLYEKYGDQYDSFYFTGHSLGGALSVHAAITAPEGMQEKTEGAVSYDGPGFSDEYVKQHEEDFKRNGGKIHHFEYSAVGSLLNEHPDIDDRVIRAHDSRDQTPPFKDLKAKFARHAVENIEFDENGNVMDGERGDMQESLGPVSRMLENLFSFGDLNILAFMEACFELLMNMADLAKQGLEQIVDLVKEKMDELYTAFVSSRVSGEFEIHASEICGMADDLDDLNRSLKRIADQVNDIKRSLPYNSMSAFYYKNCLGQIAIGITSEGQKAEKIARTAEEDVQKYTQGDQKVASLFI